ncbi:unnamed protein product, partial [Closterium sp. NIES-54]
MVSCFSVAPIHNDKYDYYIDDYISDDDPNLDPDVRTLRKAKQRRYEERLAKEAAKAAEERERIRQRVGGVVVVGVDVNESGQKVVDFAIENMVKRGGKLVLVHVATVTPLVQSGPGRSDKREVKSRERAWWGGYNLHMSHEVARLLKPHRRHCRAAG